MPLFISSQNERMQFENAKTALSNDPNVSQTALANAVCTQSFLRLMAPVVINQTIFNFPVLNNQSGSGLTQRVEEQKLAQQDAFFVSKCFVYITKAPSALGTNWVPSTYPNAVTFPTGSAQLYQIYTGKLQITINNSVIVPAYPMQQFLNIPATQLTAATNSPQDQFNGVELMPWEPNVVFVGLYNSQIQIILPNGMTAVDANTFLVVEVEGVLAQNVALGAIK